MLEKERGGVQQQQQGLRGGEKGVPGNTWGRQQRRHSARSDVSSSTHASAIDVHTTHETRLAGSLAGAYERISGQVWGMLPPPPASPACPPPPLFLPLLLPQERQEAGALRQQGIINN